MPAGLLHAFASAFTQENRLLRLQLGSGIEAATRLLPQTLRGHHCLSAPYRYELDCLTDNALLELKDLLGLPVQIGILTAQGHERMICGIVTAAETLGADGGFSSYRLIIEPALALLGHRHTSRVFQDQTVPEIVQCILDEHIAANPVLATAFKHESHLVQTYPQRSYCLQYRENDLAFITRLLREEGIAWRFAFTAGDLPLHTLILFDDPYSIAQGPVGRIRFHRADGTEQADGLQQWRGSRQIVSNRIDLCSFDYKQVTSIQSSDDSRIDQGQGGEQAQRSLHDYDPQTLYYGDAGDLARYASLRQQAIDLSARSFTAQGTARDVTVGEWFLLDGHPVHDYDTADQREFTLVGETLTARNNLPSELQHGLANLLGPAAGTTQDLGPSDHGQQPFRSELTLVRRGIPLTPAYARTEHAKPTALGVQTATVVGPANEEIFTDAMGRIRIQFHWQRAQEHREFGAGLDDRSSCWIRVAYPSAGAGWGHQFIPRIGQEVLVDFIEGDIDRPIVTGVVYNGTHTPPTFSDAGNLPANKTLSGIKSKEYKGYRFNELLLDDSAGQIRAKLSSEHGFSQLNLGYLIHPRKDGSGQPRGEGAELRTDQHLAIRGGHGLLLSAEAATGASGKQLMRQQAQSQLDGAFSLVQQLADAAAHQLADRQETGQDEQTIQPDNSQGPRKPNGHLHHLQHALKSWEAGSNTDKDGNSSSRQQPGQQGLIALSAPAGIVSATPQAQAHTAGTNLDLIAQRDTNQTSGRRWLHNVGQHISLFVLGVKERVSLKLIAARGHIRMQAQNDSIEIDAAKDIRIKANQRLHLFAGDEILLAAGGGYIRLKGGNIQIHCPGNLTLKAASHAWSGPDQMQTQLTTYPTVCQSCLEKAIKQGAAAIPRI